MSTKMASRDERIDSVKYCLMVLVIVGHVFAQRQFVSTPGCTAVWKWIYMFHMPLFVFLSGYFSSKKDNRQFIKSCWRLLEPLLIFQIFIRVWEYSGSVSLRDVFTPWWTLWYLLSLLYWRTILQIIPNKILDNKAFLISATFVISLLAGFLPFNRLMSVQRSLSFMPFFFFGYCMKGKNIFISEKYRMYSCLFLILTMVFAMFFAKYLGDLNQADPYATPMGICYRLLVFSLSIPMSIAFINICPGIPWFAKLGRLTLQYYL